MTDMDRAREVLISTIEPLDIYGAEVLRGGQDASIRASHVIRAMLAFAAERPGVGEERPGLIVTGDVMRKAAEKAEIGVDRAWRYMDALKEFGVPSLAPPPSASVEGERSPAQFFFEVGFGACWAEAFVKNGSTPPFPLTDAAIERAWAIAGEAHDDPEEFDRYLALASAPPIPATCGGEGELPRCVGVSRMFDNEKALLVSFRSKPSDDDLRAIHDLLGEG